MKIHRGFSDFLAWMLRCVVRYRRDVVFINLSRSFPEKNYKEIDALSRDFYRHLADIVTEALWFGRRRGGRGRLQLHDSGIVDVVNPEVFNEVYDSSASMMVLASHAGNWELLGGWFCYNHNPDVAFRSGYPEIAVVYRAAESAFWNRIIARNRCAPLSGTGFNGYLESREVFRFAVSHRKEKFIYIFPTDQYPYKGVSSHGVGKFMNQETLAMTGGTALACKMGMSVSYLRWKVRDRGRYGVEFVPICADASAETPEGLMEKYYALLEQDIRQQPWNYLWSHRRWK